jgi:FAD/FMN-containing dehydrogenase
MTDLPVLTTDGDADTLSANLVEAFRAQLRGELLCAGDAGYDTARRVWNGMIDKRPAMIARCTGQNDVVTCINFAQEHGVLISVRGGGHNYAGKAICDGGLVIDLSPMKGIVIDPERQTARAQAGLRLGEFDLQTQKFGLATTLGVNRDTGIAGLTLGGGHGWLAGKYGLACDNLLSAEVVTSDGSVISCNKDQYDDLFWGLRGAGATIGVVLTGADGSPAFASILCYCGAPSEGEKVLKPLRTFEKPVADLIQPRSYLEMQGLLDETWPPGRHYYNKAHNIRKVSDGAIDTILRYSAILPTTFTNIAFQQLHGAASRIPTNDTAFPHRYNHYDLLVHPATENPSDTDNMIRWARQCWGDLQPFVERVVYVNALEDALEEGERRVREAYGANYKRLVDLKTKYDPMNVFQQNSNIKPEVSVN